MENKKYGRSGLFERLHINLIRFPEDAVESLKQWGLQLILIEENANDLGIEFKLIGAYKEGKRFNMVYSGFWITHKEFAWWMDYFTAAAELFLELCESGSDVEEIMHRLKYG